MKRMGYEIKPIKNYKVRQRLKDGKHKNSGSFALKVKGLDC